MLGFCVCRNRASGLRVLFCCGVKSSMGVHVGLLYVRKSNIEIHVGLCRLRKRNMDLWVGLCRYLSGIWLGREGFNRVGGVGFFSDVGFSAAAGGVGGVFGFKKISGFVFA